VGEEQGCLGHLLSHAAAFSKWGRQPLVAILPLCVICQNTGTWCGWREDGGLMWLLKRNPKPRLPAHQPCVGMSPECTSSTAKCIWGPPLARAGKPQIPLKYCRLDLGINRPLPHSTAFPSQALALHYCECSLAHSKKY
jgi:hypothetical protein